MTTTTTNHAAEVAALRAELASLEADARPTLNHPTATDEQWTRARRMVERAARAAGFSADMADELASVATERMLTRRYRTTSPTTPTRAAWRIVLQCRRYGWGRLIPRVAGSHDPDRFKQAVEGATMKIARQRAANLTPQQMAERAERWNGIQRGAAIRAARAASLYEALAASQGIGPAAHDHEQDDAARWTAAVPSGRPPHRLPLQGCPGLHTDCDPVPGSHARAAEECRRHAAALAD